VEVQAEDMGASPILAHLPTYKPTTICISKRILEAALRVCWSFSMGFRVADAGVDIIMWVLGDARLVQRVNIPRVLEEIVTCVLPVSTLPGQVMATATPVQLVNTPIPAPMLPPAIRALAVNTLQGRGTQAALSVSVGTTSMLPPGHPPARSVPQVRILRGRDTRSVKRALGANILMLAQQLLDAIIVRRGSILLAMHTPHA
jgi:hypothetical protein